MEKKLLNLEQIMLKLLLRILKKFLEIIKLKKLDLMMIQQ